MSRHVAEVGSAASSYEVLAKLAVGGMAEIFLARGVSSAGVERYVVLKRVLRHRASDAHFISMFLDEARLAAQLQHPNVAQVYDIGKLGDSYFFTMEYVHGETVRALLQRSHALRQNIPIGSVLSVIAGAAAGLHHAHERKGMDGKPLGIVHRDVSPSNLMISYEGTVKVVDFGVAKATHREAETRSGTVKGKITYMSPEQCKGGDLDRRSDLFALGIVMWEMLSTERLFRRNSDFENMQAIVSEAVPPPSTLRPEIPAAVDAIVMKLLAKNPADRFQTADELHEAIETVALKTASALSPASLGRYMRELFGQRPEPWIELQSQMNQPEVTVTSEPIPGDLGASPSDELDLQLSAVPLLSERMTAQQLPAAQPQPMPTIPLRLQIDSIAPARAATSQPVATLMMPPAPQYPVVQRSSSHSMSGYSASTYPPPARKRSVALVVVVAAAVIGIGVGVVLAVSGDKKSAPAAPAPVAVTLPAAMAPPAPAAVAPPAPAAVAPRAPAAVAPRAPAPVAPPAPAHATPPAEPARPVPAPAEPPRPPPKAAPAHDVAALVANDRHEEAVTACNASSKIVASNATSCTVAACKVRETSKAKRWFARVTASRRAAVIEDCGGVLPSSLLEPKGATRPAPKADDDLCKREPLACQH